MYEEFMRFIQNLFLKQGNQGTILISNQFSFHAEVELSQRSKLAAKSGALPLSAGSVPASCTSVMSEKVNTKVSESGLVDELWCSQIFSSAQGGYHPP